MSKKTAFFMLAAFFAVLFFSRTVSANYFTGKVLSSSRQAISVKSADGRIVQFSVGWRTKYYPNRLPMRGERVKVYYRYGRGRHVGYRVTILPPSPPPVQAPDRALKGEVTVTVSRANIRSGPGTEYNIIATAGAQETLSLKGQTGSWYQIYVPDRDKTGWIYSDIVRIDRMEEAERD